MLGVKLYTNLCLSSPLQSVQKKTQTHRYLYKLTFPKNGYKIKNFLWLLFPAFALCEWLYIYNLLHLSQFYPSNLHKNMLPSKFSPASNNSRPATFCAKKYIIRGAMIGKVVYDEVVACGSIILQSKTVWGRYSSVNSKKNTENR